MSDSGTRLDVGRCKRIVLVVELVTGHLVARIAPEPLVLPSDRPFPRRVRRLRKRLGNISPGALAERLGVCPSTVVAWEEGIHEPQKMHHQAVVRLERQWRRWFVEMSEREAP